jgi:hypothetical protein
MAASCRLCGQPGELQDSHVLPAFVFRWLKETSGTGFMRFGQEPNRRIQDGFRKQWLCLTCEQRLNVWETQFATKLFHSLNQNSGSRVPYSEWLLKFCVSVSWRSLLMMIEDFGLKHFSKAQQNAAVLALETWRGFLLEKNRHPGRFEQHLLPLDSVDHFTLELPANFNRYVLRAVEIDAVHGEKTAFIFSKLGRFFILGFIDVVHASRWAGTKVHVRDGVIQPRQYTLPIEFGDYLVDRAKRHAAIYGKISDAQRRKIDEAFRKNIDRVANSETFNAMTEDVRTFGSAAFKIHETKDKDIS